MRKLPHAAGKRKQLGRVAGGPTRAGPAGTTSVPTIIIIDDDEEVRVATENLVRSYGLEAHGFSSAQEFLDSPELELAACLVTDVQMPGMTGLELQAALNRRGRNVPTIFITAYPEDRLRRQAEEGGALCFLSKPFDATVLMEYIHQAISQSPR
jgi:FixJ family two-component response regulator